MGGVKVEFKSILTSALDVRVERSASLFGRFTGKPRSSIPLNGMLCGAGPYLNF
jgi:hypothetical protein